MIITELVETEEFAKGSELQELYETKELTDTISVCDGEWRKVEAWQFWRNPARFVGG